VDSGEGVSALAVLHVLPQASPSDDRHPEPVMSDQPLPTDALPDPAPASRSLLRRPSSPAALLRQLGLKPRRGLSQSFLTDVGVTRKIASAAGLTPEDDVLEVGPGLGILTQELARRARRVVAFELDRQLAAVLPSMLPANVQVVQGDALTLDPADYLSGPYKLAANLPYQITSPFLFRYLSIQPAPSVLVLMVQREVAERISAPVGDLSYLAVAVQSAARPQIVRLVPAGAFHPRPRVESAVVKLEPLADPLVPPSQRDAFLELVRAGFGQPRKQLLNSLEQGFSQARIPGWPRAEIRDLLVRAGISSERRPQELRLIEWRTLFEAYLAIRGGRAD
jgi:16S rRNA (adenine1518-N6/adenine1519-N6)-dimethyltransferase